MVADSASPPTTGRERSDSPSERDAPVCLGAIVGAHGIRGGVRIKPFTADPRAVGAYGPLTDESGARSFRLAIRDVRGGVVTARIEGVRDRNAAEALRGTRLYVPRSALPPPEEDEFYHADLIGLPAELADGTAFGTVRSLEDHGAGTVIELKPAAGGMPLVLPFTRDFVPVVDVAGGRVVIDPPAALLVRSKPDDGADDATAEDEVAEDGPAEDGKGPA